MEYPQFGLSGHVALVTGAARGLGRAISLALAHAGADVALGLRDVKADSGLAAEIRKMERKTLPLQMDMRRLEQIYRAVDEHTRRGVAPDRWRLGSGKANRPSLPRASPHPFSRDAVLYIMDSVGHNWRFFKRLPN